MSDTVYSPPVSHLEWPLILRRLSAVSFAETKEITALEQEIYEAVRRRPEDINCRILLLQVQLMLGRVERAKVMAYKIWEEGGEMDFQPEQVYINALISLNLHEMAEKLLKPLVSATDGLSAGVFETAMRYALASGEKTLFARLAAAADETLYPKLENLYDFYEEHQYWPHFKQFQNIIFKILENRLAFYEYAFLSDRGFTDLQISLYTNENASAAADLEDKINEAIIAYCAAKNIKRYYNFTVKVWDLKAHPALDAAALPA